MDNILERAWEGKVTYALTNLVACIPLGEDGKKTQEPPKESIIACGSRLKELIELADPIFFVCVGKLAAKWLPELYKELPIDSTVEIIHPAAIVRASRAQRGILRQRAIATLTHIGE